MVVYQESLGAERIPIKNIFFIPRCMETEFRCWNNKLFKDVILNKSGKCVSVLIRKHQKDSVKIIEVKSQTLLHQFSDSLRLCTRLVGSVSWFWDVRLWDSVLTLIQWRYKKFQLWCSKHWILHLKEFNIGFFRRNVLVPSNISLELLATAPQNSIHLHRIWGRNSNFRGGHVETFFFQYLD